MAEPSATDRSATSPTLYLKLLIFLLLVPATVAVYVPLWLIANRPPDFQAGPLRWLGFAPVVVGSVFLLLSGLDFARKGRGTPAPIDAPKFLVTSNLYRVVRNPMYVGVVMVLAGEALLFQSFVVLRYATVVWLGFHLFVILYEEPTLRGKFGADYEEYCRRVPRWVPNPRRG